MINISTNNFDKTTVTLKVFHIDGAGARPDGSGSGYAWVRIGTEKRRITWMDGLTNNEAEYRGLLCVLKYLAVESRAVIHTDSQLVCQQFNRRWAVNDQKLLKLLSTARELIEDKGLQIELKWLPREQNLAGKLLERSKRAQVSLEHSAGRAGSEKHNASGKG